MKAPNKFEALVIALSAIAIGLNIYRLNQPATFTDAECKTVAVESAEFDRCTFCEKADGSIGAYVCIWDKTK